MDRYNLRQLILLWLAVLLGPNLLAAQPCRQQAATMPAVQWIEPAEEADHRAMRRWCETVGPAAWLAPDRPHDTDDSLLVVSWNVHVGGGDIESLLDSLRLGRLTDGRPVRDFVLLLQEVFRRGEMIPDIVAGDPTPKRIEVAPPSGSRRDIVETATKRGLWLFYVPSMRNGPGLGAQAEDRGNAILSTLPLGELTAIELPFEGQRRVALLADVGGAGDGRAWRLKLCNVHLDNRSAGSRFFASFGPGRLRQARFVLQVLPPGHLILGGDLNTWMPVALERTLPLLGDAFLTPPETDLPPTYSRALLPDRRVDHLFFRIPAAEAPPVQRVENRFGSDHHPVLAWIPLNGLGRDPRQVPPPQSR